jgi:hypothetical protein
MDPFADNITLSDKIAAYVPGPDTAGGPIAIPFQNPQSSFLPTYPINTYPRVDTIYRSHTFMGSGNYYVAPNPGIMLNYTDLDSIIVAYMDSARATPKDSTTINKYYHRIYFNR